MKKIIVCAVVLFSACVNLSMQASGWEDGQKELYRVSRAFAHVHKKKSVKRVGRKKNSKVCNQQKPPQDPKSIFKRHHWRSHDLKDKDFGPQLPIDLVTFKSDDICPPTVRSYEAIDIRNQSPATELQYLTIQEKMMLIVKMDLLPQALAYMVACYAQENISLPYLMSDDVSPARKFLFTNEPFSIFTPKKRVDEALWLSLWSIPAIAWIYKSKRGNSLRYRGLDKGIRGSEGLGVDATDIRVKSAVENIVRRKYMAQFIPQVTPTNYSNTGDGAEAMISDFVELDEVSEASQKPRVLKYSLEEMD